MQGDIRNNPAMSRFELPLRDGALAVPYYRTDDGRFVLLHTEVPPDFWGREYGPRLAPGVFEALRHDRKRVIAKVDLPRPAPRIRCAPLRLIAGVGAMARTPFLAPPYAVAMECMSKENF